MGANLCGASQLDQNRMSGVEGVFGAQNVFPGLPHGVTWEGIGDDITPWVFETYKVRFYQRRYFPGIGLVPRMRTTARTR